MIYLIGSLRQPRVPAVAKVLRAEGFDIFDDWHSQGKEADQEWRDYEKHRGRSYREALAGKAACHAFDFDYRHLQQANAAVLVHPCGASGHLELGWTLGQGKPGFILLDGEPERYELMVKFATAICYTVEELIEELRKAGI